MGALPSSARTHANAATGGVDDHRDSAGFVLGSRRTRVRSRRAGTAACAEPTSAAGQITADRPSATHRNDRAERQSARDDQVIDLRDAVVADLPLLAGSQLPRIGLWRWDGAGIQIDICPVAAQIMDLPAGSGTTVTQLRRCIASGDLPVFNVMLSKYLNDGASGSALVQLTTGHRGTRRVRISIDAQGISSRAAWGTITEVARSSREVREYSDMTATIQAAEELTGMGRWRWNPVTEELVWSQQMFTIAGLKPDDPQPDLQWWHGIINPNDVAQATNLDRNADLDAVGAVSLQTFQILGADGAVRHVQSWSQVVADESGPVVVGVTIDITQQVIDHNVLHSFSTTDTLTNLANRLGFDRHIQELLLAASHDITVFLLDLDRFKLINDSLGHQLGDRLLVEVARRLEKVVGPYSLTARMGGDEFLVVPPPGLSEDQIRELAQEIIEELRLPYVLPVTGEVLVCPASVGVTSTAGRGDVSVDVLLSEADLALYRAKDNGRDRYVVFNEGLWENARQRHRAEQRLRKAVEQNRLMLRYQPIVDFAHGRVVGAEALVRMRTSAGLVTPEEFVEVAEDTGLVVELDCWVINAALDQLAQWLENSDVTDVPWLAVNVSPRSMERSRVANVLLEGMAQRNIAPHLVKVELTERSFLSSIPGDEEPLQHLIDAGIGVGIDDFGTGYSALAYLPRYSLDFMKIDRSFVRSVGSDERSDAVVTAIVALAHAHGMKVTAEGVETPRQARRLREIGCDFAQGFHFGRPGQAERILHD